MHLVNSCYRLDLHKTQKLLNVIHKYPYIETVQLAEWIVSCNGYDGFCYLPEDLVEQLKYYFWCKSYEDIEDLAKIVNNMSMIYYENRTEFYENRSNFQL